MDLDDVESIDFRALGGADNVVVNDLSGTDLTEVNTDLAAVGGGAGDAQPDNVIVHGTNGDDVARRRRRRRPAWPRSDCPRGSTSPAPRPPTTGSPSTRSPATTWWRPPAWRPGRSSSRPTAATATTC